MNALPIHLIENCFAVKNKKTFTMRILPTLFKHIFGVQMKIDKQCKRQSLSEPNSWKPEGISTFCMHKLSLRSYNQLSLHACPLHNYLCISIFI